MPGISQAAIDLIVACEVTSRAAYDRLYRHPEWPGGASGVTVGIGYDCGYSSAAKIRSDWAGRIPASMIEAMASCAGVRGGDARARTAAVRSLIDIPWEAASSEFAQIEIPTWIGNVCRVIPGAEKLSPDCLGALVSLAYNRGASFNSSGSRYAEMRAIRQHIIDGRPELVTDEIISMKRLWGPDQRGLLVRRDKEAALWQKGLKSPAPAAVPTVNPSPPKIAPKPPATTTEKGATATVATGSAVAAANSGLSGWKLAVVIIVVIGVAAVASYLALRYFRRVPEITARVKDHPVDAAVT